MDIFINNEKLKFQLENEKNLKEIIENINNWLFKNLKVIDEIIIDGKVFKNEINDLEKYPIDKIKKLDFTIIDINQLVFNSLNETKNYLTEICSYLKSKNNFTEDDIKRLISGIGWTLNIFTRINNIYNYDKHINSKNFNFSNEINNLEKSKNKIEQLFQSKQFDKINDILKNDLNKELNKWAKNINILLEINKVSINNVESIRDNVSDQVFKIINKIPDMQKLIEMIVMDMQTGHEQEAMTNIQIITGAMESIFALLQLIKSTFSLDYNQIKFENKSIEDYNKSMTEILKELLQSMEIKDTVLLSDLLNYELNPKLEQYSDILKLIAKEINIEIN